MLLRRARCLVRDGSCRGRSNRFFFDAWQAGGPIMRRWFSWWGRPTKGADEVPVFPHWEDTDHTPIESTIEEWRAHFPKFRVLGQRSKGRHRSASRAQRVRWPSRGLPLRDQGSGRAETPDWKARRIRGDFYRSQSEPNTSTGL